MARTELPNGVILPSEYSDDWYEDMTSNLTKLDDVIGSDSEKLNADGVDFLRMYSAALTDGGTGNFSDLNSSYKIKTGDLILDSGRKLYQVVSVDSTNERFTVGNSLFKVTAESDLAPVAESGDYDDLDNKPDLNPYDQHIADTDIHVTTADKNRWNNQTYVFRYSSTALTASSTNSNALLDNTDNLKVGDKVIDSSGVLFSITAIDTANSTFTVGTALIDLAQDSDVVHKSGDETVGGVKSFSDNISAKKIISNVGQLQINARSSADSVAVIAGADASEGGGLWIYGKNSGTGSDCRLQIYNTSKSRYESVDLINSQFLPNPSGELDCGGTSKKWKTFNGLNPGALSLPDFSNAIDISSYITVTGGSTISNSYTPPTDGYISVNLGRSSGAIGLVISNGKIEACVRENTFPDNHRECGGFIPVQKNDTVEITSCLADSIIWAYFIPCIGNV